MAKPKGPEKDGYYFRVTKATSDWLKKKARENSVPTYVAEHFEQLAGNAGKTLGNSRIAGPVPTTSNASPEVGESLRNLSKDIAEQTRQELPKHLERKRVNPRFKKDGKS
jgi:hypothetical protein